jgi:hypothetical protein
MTAAVSAARRRPITRRCAAVGLRVPHARRRPRTFTELRTPARLEGDVSRLVSLADGERGEPNAFDADVLDVERVHPGPREPDVVPAAVIAQDLTSTESRGSRTTSSRRPTAFVVRSVTRPRTTCAPTGSLDASVSAVPNARAATLALFPLQSDMRAPPKPSPNSHSSALYGSYCPFTFAHVSLSVTVRLNTRRSGRESTVSLMKYPVRSN